MPGCPVISTSPPLIGARSRSLNVSEMRFAAATVVATVLIAPAPFVQPMLVLVRPVELIMRIAVLVTKVAMELGMSPRIQPLCVGDGMLLVKFVMNVAMLIAEFLNCGGLSLNKIFIAGS